MYAESPIFIYFPDFMCDCFLCWLDFRLVWIFFIKITKYRVQKS